MSISDLDKTTFFTVDTEIADSSGAGRLTIFDGGEAPKEYNLSEFAKGIITFGRSAENDIVLKSPYVSRRHGRFRYAGGIWIIEDANSRNGFIFKGVAVRSRSLADGDNVRIDDGVETTPDGVLFVFSGADAVSDWQTVTLGGSKELTIGRDPECDMVLDHVSASRVHAKITASGNEYYLTDNHSTNGVVVNGKKISGRVRLHEKDVILITNSKLIFGNGRLSWRVFKRGIRVDAESIVKLVDHKRKTICNEVSFTVEPCELVAIIGGSGAGKTTVMNCISGYNPPTKGTVQVNGMDLYQNFDALKNIIGYVPQQDIVFDNLTVYGMLNYAARLRLPDDISRKERKEIINRAMDAVELTARKNTLIKRLSGGQKKRASIAVELLSDPNLFFLDEPASGLDPGTERNLMLTLRKMASGGKTVIFVTHSTLNLHLCDKIVFMGAGGKLCFCGSYEDALKFFGINDMVDVYNLITKDPDGWNEKYTGTQNGAVPQSGAPSVAATKQRARHGMARQTAILLRRNLHILINDKVRLLMLLIQAPLLAVLISLVANGKQFGQYEMTKSLLFALSCSAFWVGILNSIQEICKERNILRREYMTGLRLGAYILSKTVTMSIICIIQSLLLTSVFVYMIGAPDTGVIIDSAFFELLSVTFLTSLSASAMGIFVSALFKNADRAMTVAPLLLMPQLLFSGMIFTLEGAANTISWIAACRFSMEGYGTIANLNSLTMKLAEQGLAIEHEAEKFYEYTGWHFLFALLVLVAYVPVFCMAAVLVLRGIKNERA